MTEPNKDPKGWKEALLKSSLPLELVVAHMLGEEGWNVGGQYTYSRANESGEDVDFSVDVVAERSLSESDPRLELKMLVECKYVSPGAQWIFSPYPESAAVDAGLVKVVDEGAHIRVIDRRTLVAFEDEMPFCVRGVQLNTGAFDETNIFRGLSQLRHAMPVVVKDEIALQYFSAQHDEGYASFCCAVLVTPAPLFHLREGLGLDDFYAAKALSEVAEEVPWLIVWEGDAPSRSRYADGQYRALLSDEADLGSYLERLAVQIPSRYRWDPIRVPALGQVNTAIQQAGHHVAVVNLSHLRAFVQRFRAAAEECASSAVVFASLRPTPGVGLVVGGPSEEQFDNMELQISQYKASKR